ncbi:MFS transporter [Labrys okinawensis]|uniref:MFS transporter n=1 Tax=Labrys okinawensis TaxID=346911 RepID=A0A2S9QA70_9HYPH|nr:MFS transporter [Labrys okinawensis]PRH86234.1 MFS transporter [Labrys okinawensis]
MSAPAQDTPSLLRHGGFRQFWSARVLSTGCFQIVSVVIGWQIYDLTHSALHLGLVGLCQFLPMLVLTIPAGHIADRFDRRTVVRCCQMVAGLTGAALALASWQGLINPAIIFAAAVVIGAGRTFEMPTTAALLPMIVSPGQLPRALALSASAIQTATIIGPALGGLLYIVGPGPAYLFVAFFYGLASILVSRLRVLAPPAAREPATLRSVFSGFSFIRSRPIILGAISLDMVAVLLGGATALLPIYARDILHTNALGLGALRASPAIGALLMSLVLARWPLERRVGLKMFGAVALFGLATVVFGLSSWFALSLPALMVMGAADVVSVVVRSTLVQLGTPDAMRGRVSAVNAMFIGTSNQLGEFESGVTAALFGPVEAVVLGGLGTILVALIWSRLFKPLRDADRFPSGSA